MVIGGAVGQRLVDFTPRGKRPFRQIRVRVVRAGRRVVCEVDIHAAEQMTVAHIDVVGFDHHRAADLPLRAD